MACLNNCNYNCTQQLARKSALLWRMDKYINDAKQCKHPNCVEVWKKIKKDEEKHVEWLKRAMMELSTKGKLTKMMKGEGS